MNTQVNSDALSVFQMLAMVAFLFLVFACKDPKGVSMENGLHKTYFNTGAVEKEFYLRDGKIEGWCKLYYLDGRLKGEQFFQNGLQQNKTTFYFPSGSIRSSVLSNG